MPGPFAEGGDVLYITDQERLGVRGLWTSGAAFAPGWRGGIDGRGSRPR